MSEILKAFNFELFKNKLSHGKWERFMDGRIHKLTFGVDYDKKRSVYAMVSNRRKKGIEIKLAFPDDKTAVVQRVWRKQDETKTN